MTEDSAEFSEPVIRDRRRLDPETGQVREPEPEVESEAAAVAADLPLLTDADLELLSGGVPAPTEPAPASEDSLAAERLEDLQRLQAEYVNYRKRVERDRDVARDLAVVSVVEALLPVLDDVHLARQHGDLDQGPFAAIADKLEAVLGRFEVQRFGEEGEPFDPAVHEALMRTEAPLAEDVTVTTVVTVLQPGYRIGDRVIRPARVAVADPQ